MYIHNGEEDGGHEHFNKSLTLGMEIRLMHYMMSAECVKHLHNLCDDPQLRAALPRAEGEREEI